LISEAIVEVANFVVSAHDADIHEAAGGDAVAKVTHADREHGDIQRDESYHEKV
jgi:hypothetical protein